MAALILFGTEGCHLCEEAMQLLADAGIEFQTVDIISDLELQEKYSLLIPVLWHKSDCRLAWPFNAEQLRKYLDSLALQA